MNNSLKIIVAGFVVFLVAVFLLGYINNQERLAKHPELMQHYISSCKIFYNLEFGGEVIKVDKEFMRSPFHSVYVRISQKENRQHLERLNGVMNFGINPALTWIKADVLRGVVEYDPGIQEGYFLIKERYSTIVDIYDHKKSLVGSFDGVGYYNNLDCADVLRKEK
ncbi:MAG: hypothetical protein ACK4ND_03510 [Cytophagaceae bacterium]